MIKMIEDLKFSVMTSLTNENLNVEIYSFDTGITKIITLNDAIETYYKNSNAQLYSKLRENFRSIKGNMSGKRKFLISDTQAKVDRFKNYGNKPYF